MEGNEEEEEKEDGRNEYISVNVRERAEISGEKAVVNFTAYAPPSQAANFWPVELAGVLMHSACDPHHTHTHTHTHTHHHHSTQRFLSRQSAE